MAASKAQIQELVEAHVEEVKAKVEKAKRLSVEVEIESENGAAPATKTINFRPLNIVPLGILRKTRHNSQEQMWSIFEWALALEDLEILDQVSSDKLNGLLEEMQEASGTTPGES